MPLCVFVLNILSIFNLQPKVELIFKCKYNDRFQLFYSELIDSSRHQGWKEVNSITKNIKGTKEFQKLIFEIPEEVIPFIFRIDFGQIENEIDLKKIKLIYNDDSITWTGMEIWQNFRKNIFMQDICITQSSFRFNTRIVNNKIDPHFYLWPKTYKRIRFFFGQLNVFENKICLFSKSNKQENLFFYPIIDNEIRTDKIIKNQIMPSKDFTNTCFYTYSNKRLSGFRIDLGNKPNSKLLLKSISFESPYYNSIWDYKEVEKSFIFYALEKKIENKTIIIKPQNDGFRPVVLFEGKLIPEKEILLRKLISFITFLLTAILLFKFNIRIFLHYKASFTF